MPQSRSRLGVSIGWWLAKNAILPATVGTAVFRHQDKQRKLREKAEKEMRKKRLEEMGFKVASAPVSAALIAVELAGHEKTAGVGRALGGLIKAPFRAMRLPFQVAHAAVKAPGIALKYGIPIAAMAAPPIVLGGYLLGKSRAYGRDADLDSAYPDYR